MCVLSTSNDFYRTSNDGLQIISDGFLLMDFFFLQKKFLTHLLVFGLLKLDLAIKV